MKATSRKGGRLAAAGASGALLCVAALTGIAPPAVAAPDSLTLKYQCGFPLIGKEPVTVKISTDIPETVKVGEQLPRFVVDSVSTVSAGSTKGLAAIHTTTLEGVARATARLSAPEYPDGLGVRVNSLLEKTNVPESGAFDVEARGAAPSLNFSKPGHGTITVGDLLLSLTPKLDDGLPSGLGTFESECTQEPGQDNVLAEFDIVGDDPVEPAIYVVKGSTDITATVSGTMPLTGAFKPEFADDGAFTGSFALDPTEGALQLFGFLPVSAGVTYTPDGATSGKRADGALRVTSRQYVGLTSVRMFGFPIGGGPSCTTTEPAEMGLTAESWDAARGGALTGTYTVPAFTGCGALNDLFTAAASGPGNTLDLAATPQQTG